MEKLLLRIFIWLTFLTGIFSIIEGCWSKTHSHEWFWTGFWLMMTNWCFAQAYKKEDEKG
jgi:hypothetical protein